MTQKSRLVIFALEKSVSGPPGTKQWTMPTTKLWTLSKPTFPHPAWRCWDWDCVDDISPLPAGPQSGAVRQMEGEWTHSFLFCFLPVQVSAMAFCFRFPAFLSTPRTSVTVLSPEAPLGSAPSSEV